MMQREGERREKGERVDRCGRDGGRERMRAIQIARQRGCSGGEKVKGRGEG